MSAIQLQGASLPNVSQMDAQPKKPLSLAVHEIAVPVLKGLTGLFLLVTIGSFVLAGIGVAPGSLPFFLIGIWTAFAAALACLGLFGLHEKAKEELTQLKNPEWAAYFSKTYQNRSLKELMQALPNQESWTRLNWSDLEWKEKVLSHATQYKMNREQISTEFKWIFCRVDPLLKEYYRDVELSLLQNQGYRALFDQSLRSEPVAVTKGELRKQVLKETAGCSCKKVIEQFGMAPFSRGHLNIDDLVERFDAETKEMTLAQIGDTYPSELLNEGAWIPKGLLSSPRFTALIDSAIQSHPDWKYPDFQREFSQFTRRRDWFQSEELQKLLVERVLSPQFSYSESGISSFTEEQTALFPPSIAHLLREMKAEWKKAYLGNSRECNAAKARYHNEPTSFYVNFGYQMSCYCRPPVYQPLGRWIDNPRVERLRSEYDEWIARDAQRQKEAYAALDQKLRLRIAEETSSSSV